MLLNNFLKTGGKLTYLVSIFLGAFCCFPIYAVSDDMVSQQHEAKNRLYKLINQDPIDNANSIISNFIQIQTYRDEESALSYWEYSKSQLAWIVVYIGENAHQTDDVLDVLNRIDETFKAFTFPNSIVFKDERDSLARKWAHRSTTLTRGHDFTADRPVGRLVSGALRRIRERGVPDIMDPEKEQ